MSLQRSRRNKERRRSRTQEEKDIALKIRLGELPRFFFKRTEGDAKSLERKAQLKKSDGKWTNPTLTFRLVGTFKLLKEI